MVDFNRNLNSIQRRDSYKETSERGKHASFPSREKRPHLLSNAQVVSVKEGVVSRTSAFLEEKLKRKSKSNCNSNQKIESSIRTFQFKRRVQTIVNFVAKVQNIPDYMMRFSYHYKQRKSIRLKRGIDFSCTLSRVVNLVFLGASTVRSFSKMVTFFKNYFRNRKKRQETQEILKKHYDATTFNEKDRRIKKIVELIKSDSSESLTKSMNQLCFEVFSSVKGLVFFCAEILVEGVYLYSFFSGRLISLLPGVSLIFYCLDIARKVGNNITDVVVLHNVASAEACMDDPELIKLAQSIKQTRQKNARSNLLNTGLSVVQAGIHVSRYIAPAIAIPISLTVDGIVLSVGVTSFCYNEYNYYRESTRVIRTASGRLAKPIPEIEFSELLLLSRLRSSDVKEKEQCVHFLETLGVSSSMICKLQCAYIHEAAALLKKVLYQDNLQYKGISFMGTCRIFYEVTGVSTLLENVRAGSAYLRNCIQSRVQNQEVI